MHRLAEPMQTQPVRHTRPYQCKALGIVYRTIATHLIRKAGYTRTTAHTGAATLIQRFGSALNLNIHFHMLFLDGVYIDDASRHSFAGSKPRQAASSISLLTP